MFDSLSFKNINQFQKMPQSWEQILKSIKTFVWEDSSFTEQSTGLNQESTYLIFLLVTKTLDWVSCGLQQPQSNVIVQLTIGPVVGYKNISDFITLIGPKKLSVTTISKSYQFLPSYIKKYYIKNRKMAA